MDFAPIQPAAILTVGLLGVILADLFGKGKRPFVPLAIAVASLVAAWISVLQLELSGEIVLGVLVVDDFAAAFTVICCATGALSILATTRGEAFRKPGGEYLALILAAVLGMSFIAMSVDLVMLYLAFETISIPSYVLVAMRRGDSKSNEAGLKYVLFGAVSSAVMLYGLSMLIGLSGGTSLEALATAVSNGAADQPMFVVACVMVFAGFAFKLSAVPFHFWAPDVYAGAPSAVAGFLAVASKAGGFIALIRVVAHTVPLTDTRAADALTTFLPSGHVFLTILAVAAVLSMTVGNLAALRQTELKRLLAWSSIAHAGYVLLAISVWGERALAATLFYLIAYLFMNLAAFFIAGIVIRERGTGELSALRGLGRKNVLLGAGFVVVLFSLTGLPPFFGFAAKLQLFYAVFEQDYVWLGVIGLLNGVVSLYYYVRVIAAMYLQDPEDGEEAKPLRLGWQDMALLGALVLPLLVLGLFWSDLWLWAQDVSRVLVLGEVAMTHAVALSSDLIASLQGLFTRMHHSAGGYAVDADPYTVAADAPVLAELEVVRTDDTRHALLLANLLQHFGLVPEAGVFPWWHRDLNYLSVPYTAGFVADSLAEDLACFDEVHASLPSDQHLIATTLKTVRAERAERLKALQPLVAEAREREAQQYASESAAISDARNARLAKEKAAAEAARKAASDAKKAAAAKAAAATPAGDPTAGMPDPNEPGISGKEKAKRTMMIKRAQKKAATAAPAAADPTAGMPDPNEPGISGKEKAKRTMMIKRAQKKAAAAAPAAADPTAGMPDPDEPGISGKEKAKRTMMIKRAQKKAAEAAPAARPRE